MEVALPSEPAGWCLRLRDSTGTIELTDTDADSMPDLGHVAPGEQRRFSFEVQSQPWLVGDGASFVGPTFAVTGHLGNRPAVADTARLKLSRAPGAGGFSAHCFPNPLVNRTASVVYLPAEGMVSLTVYTRTGQRVRRVLERETRSAGVHVVPWEAVNDHGQDVAPGTYDYVLDYVHPDTTERIHKKLVVTRE